MYPAIVDIIAPRAMIALHRYNYRVISLRARPLHGHVWAIRRTAPLLCTCQLSHKETNNDTDLQSVLRRLEWSGQSSSHTDRARHRGCNPQICGRASLPPGDPGASPARRPHALRHRTGAQRNRGCRPRRSTRHSGMEKFDQRPIREGHKPCYAWCPTGDGEDVSRTTSGKRSWAGYCSQCSAS